MQMFEQPGIVALAILLSLVVTGLTFLAAAVVLATVKERLFWKRYDKEKEAVCND